MIKRKRLVGCIVLTVLGASCALYILLQQNSMPSQLYAERFSSDGTRYAQISSFFTYDNVVYETNINNYRSSIQKALEEASVESEHKNGRLWVDCYSGEVQAETTNDNNKETVQLIGVGGDYFQFHPLTLISGYYFSPDDVMKDRVLISEEVAWQLFGSNDVVGMDFTVGEKICYIAGVFKQPDEKMEKKAIGDEPLVFASMDVLNQVGGDDARISCYEILLPNPVSDFARQMVYKSVAGVDLSSDTASDINLDELNVEIVQNTRRFSIPRIFQIIKTMQTRVMARKPLQYPYWENIARAKETQISYMLILCSLFFLVPVLSLITYLIRRFKKRKWTWKNIKGKIDEKIEDRKMKQWEEKKNVQKKLG